MTLHDQPTARSHKRALSLATVLGCLAAPALFASPAAAQSTYGEWTNNLFNPNTFYVSPTGSDLNSGLSPASPLRTIDQALQNADWTLANLYPALQEPVTINLAPGLYNLTGPIETPAYGVSIEPSWSSDPNAEVIIRKPAGSWNAFQFTMPYGPLVQAVVDEQPTNPFEDLPPSILRGLQIQGTALQGEFWGTGVYIDPSLNNPAAELPSDCAVGVHQCEFQDLSTGIRITRNDPDSRVYRNELIDNEILVDNWGIQIVGAGVMSDLIRSNRISDSQVGLAVQASQGQDGGRGIRPRILSNSFTNIGAHNLQPIGGFPVSSCIEFGDGVSAQVVGNTFAFLRHNCPNQSTCTPLPGFEPAAISYFGNGPEVEQATLVIANNLFYNPPYQVSAGGFFDPLEIYFRGGVFPGTLIIESNDFDDSGPLVTPTLDVRDSNIAIGDPQFVGGTFGAFDPHLTPGSLGVVNFGDLSFTEPGSNSSFQIGDETFLANCALDFDLDARTHQTATSAEAVLFRGADQFVQDGIRLSAPTSVLGGTPAGVQLADRFGNIAAQVGSDTTVRLEVAAPAGSVHMTVLCSTLPMGPEVQQVVLPPIGSLALDPGAGNAVVINVGMVTSGVASFDWNMGTLLPAYLEAEMYLQSLVLRPNGTFTFTNRIRIDVEQP